MRETLSNLPVILARHLILCCVLIWASLPANAQDIYLSGHVGEDHMSVWELRRAGVEQLDMRSTEPRFNFGFDDRDAWLVVPVKNGYQRLWLDNPNLNTVDLYHFRKGVLIDSSRNGDHVPVSQRSVQHREVIFALDAVQGDTLFLRLNNGGERFFFNLRTIDDQQELAASLERNGLMNAFYLGVIFFVVVFNLFLMVFIKERYNWYYLGYVLGVALLDMSYRGYLRDWMPWASGEFLDQVAPILATVSVLSLLLFTVKFLDLPQYMPRSTRYLNWFKWAIVAVLLISLVPNSSTYKVSVLGINGLALVLNVIVLPISWKVMSKGYRPARFFSLAFTVLIGCVFVFLLSNFGLIQGNVWTDRVVQIGTAAEVVLLTLAIVDRFRIFREESMARLQEINRMRQRANEELERKVQERTQEIMRKNTEIAQQKELIEERNRETMESIRYASRIQGAILPTSSYIESLVDSSFVLYMPRDIVSGDFYWFADVKTTPAGGLPGEDLVVGVVADCTGHGVPGAMLSILGANFFNMSLARENVNSPGEALDFVNHGVSSTLNRYDGGEKLRDGMDAAMFALDKSSGRLRFAGANNPLYLVSGGDLVELKGDKRAIGGPMDRTRFNTLEHQLNPGDCIYVFSDGFADQFGGDRGKKMKYKRFKELLLEIQTLPMEQQKRELESFFLEWKGDLEQVDDVCVVGIRYE